MLLEQLKNYKIGHLIILPLFAIALWANTFYDLLTGELVKYGTFHLPLFRLLIQPFRDPSLLVYASILALLFIITQAFYVNSLVNRYKLFEERTFMPAYIFILLLSLYLDMQKLHPALLANFFLLFSINHLLASIKNRHTLHNIFYASLLIAIGSLFYLQTMIFLLLVWITIVFLKRSSFREFLISIFAAALPYILEWAFYFIKNGDAKELKVDILLGAGFIQETIYELDVIYYIAFGFILFIGLIAIFRMLASLRFKINETRDQLMVFFFMLLIAIGSYFTSIFTLEMITFAAVALSIIISDYFYNIKGGWLSESIIYAILLLLIFVQVVN